MAMGVSKGYARKKSRDNGNLMRNIFRHKALYIMSIPGIVFFIILKYMPMLGNVIAFQDYNIYKGIFKSRFAGLEYFAIMFNYGDFLRIFLNNMIISFYDILFAFPAPLVLALLLNEVVNAKFKKTVQSVIYLPHFLSWVVLGGIIATQFLSLNTGILNYILQFLGQKPIYFLTQPQYARGIVILAGIWKDVGWGTIIYLAAISGIDPNLYEAASLDGAGRIRQLVHITIPSIAVVIVVLMLIRIGHFLDFGFDRVWIFLNGANSEKIDIFDTYVYRVAFEQQKFSYATAVGLFKSFVGLILIFFANKLSNKFTGQGLY